MGCVDILVHLLSAYICRSFRLCCNIVSVLLQECAFTTTSQSLAVHGNRKSGQEVFGNREEERHLRCALFDSVHKDRAARRKGWGIYDQKGVWVCV